MAKDSEPLAEGSFSELAIGRGEHQRPIIKRERLLAGAAKRRGAE